MRKARLSPNHTRQRPDFSLAIVNIVLLLVFFFLITGSLVQQGETSVDLAATTELPLERLPRPLLLVDAQGAMALDGVAVTADTLAGLLGPQMPEALYLLADKGLSADLLMALTTRPDLAAVSMRLITLHERRVALP
ncbi:biopolymer transporter ExbD [Pseudorhodobacter sp.]|uniref:ExbD/TolR family protein n=1 Tax=Pseudorhodobacter sp. TaxID=1934400 RepID=UPI002648E68F|nr:biopolymer transporter ExbD [Pseudorhodobacter sp.]MDN5786749.1 biopolymer transporter ExbD [Pseudorhodobacter sp.]